MDFWFQSTHPRGVRRVRRSESPLQYNVSIHAPAWGATRTLRSTSPSISVFQSTHPRGVRPKVIYNRQCSQRSFNPRTRVGCDHGDPGLLALPESFNPRTRVGCDYVVQARHRDTTRFQSTHPRGVRRTVQARHRGTSWFQSTHPRGVRPAPPAPAARRLSVSIHAPAWGATIGVGCVAGT